MKKFEIPGIEIIRFAVSDIITSSSGYDDELPLIPQVGEVEDHTGLSGIKK